jgi:23S rRNA (uridine2552-2'-O)-methyltransferase
LCTVPQRRELHDRFFKQAKAEGYAARSAYKLKQIQDRYGVLRAGDRVLDLGCAPGSWTQVCAQTVGPRGDVVGLDLQPVEIPLPDQAQTIVADIFKSPAEQLLALGRDPGRAYDALLSDMAPNTTGSPQADHFRSVELCRRVLALAPALLAPGGYLAMKVFEGEDYPALLRETQRLFSGVKGYKPEATRQVSREMFIVARGFKAAAARPVPSRPAAARPVPSRPAPASTTTPASKHASASPNPPAAPATSSPAAPAPPVPTAAPASLTKAAPASPAPGGAAPKRAAAKPKSSTTGPRDSEPGTPRGKSRGRRA